MGIRTDTDRELQTTQAASTRATLSPPPREQPSMSVVSAIAEATGEDPQTMAPLYETVDTDALDTLLQTDTPLEIVFEYEGHAVEVGSDGIVTVDGEKIETGGRP